MNRIGCWLKRAGGIAVVILVAGCASPSSHHVECGAVVPAEEKVGEFKRQEYGGIKSDSSSAQPASKVETLKKGGDDMERMD